MWLHRCKISISYLKKISKKLKKKIKKSVDILYNGVYNICRKRGEGMNDLEDKIKKLCEIIQQITQLVLEIGSLIAIIKMILRQ